MMSNIIRDYYAIVGIKAGANAMFSAWIFKTDLTFSAQFDSAKPSLYWDRGEALEQLRKLAGHHDTKAFGYTGLELVKVSCVSDGESVTLS